MGAYGGYETFVYKLTEYHQDIPNIKYHVACKANGSGSRDESTLPGAKRINDHEFEYHNAICFKIKVPEWMKSAQALYYDVEAIIKYWKQQNIDDDCRSFWLYASCTEKKSSEVFGSVPAYSWRTYRRMGRENHRFACGICPPGGNSNNIFCSYASDGCGN